MLSSRAEVLALKPDYAALAGQMLGVVAPWDAARDGREAQFEVRAFIPSLATEDPVTGSLNAGLAQWLTSTGLAPNSYIASQRHAPRPRRSRLCRARGRKRLDWWQDYHLHSRHAQHLAHDPKECEPVS